MQCKKCCYNPHAEKGRFVLFWPSTGFLFLWSLARAFGRDVCSVVDRCGLGRADEAMGGWCVNACLLCFGRVACCWPSYHARTEFVVVLQVAEKKETTRRTADDDNGKMKMTVGFGFQIRSLTLLLFRFLGPAAL